MNKKPFLFILMILTCGVLFSSVAIPQERKPERKPESKPESKRSFLKGDVLDINLREAGKLNEYLPEEDIKRVRCIRLSGVINGDDIKFMKRICDRSKAVDEQDRSVDNYLDLELENARIVGGGSFMNQSERDIISSSMFSGCRHLRYIAVPRDVYKIGSEAFRGCSDLEEVRFIGRGSLRELGIRVFEDCSQLTRINLQEGLEVIGNNCFSDCSKLRRIDLPSTLREIGQYAFCNVPITDVRIPAYLTSLGAYAFSGTKITSLYLPRDVKVENDAFGYMPYLKEFQVESGNRYYTVDDGVLYDYDGTTLIRYPIAKPGDSFAVPDGVTAIGNSAFYCCSSLLNVTFPQSLLTIGANAFEQCNLQSVVVPNNVTSIGHDAFKKCTNLTRATINANTKVLSYNMFSGCSYLQTVALPSTIEKIGEGAFRGCVRLQNVGWGSAVTMIYKEAFYNCGFTQIEVPEGVTSIGDNAFRDCKNLGLISLPSSLLTMGNEVLRGCDRLSEITIPSQVTSIGENAFRDCKGLVSISLPPSLLTMGKEVMRGCERLSEIAIPSQVTSIGENAFRDCKGLLKVVFGTDLTVIDKELFRGCEQLTQVELPLGLTTIGENAFRDCKALASIELPYGLLAINDNAFRSTALTEITIPATVTQIGNKIVEKCPMQRITCRAVVPPALEKVSEKKTPLYVPAGSVEYYKRVKSWKDFKNILPIE